MADIYVRSTDGNNADNGSGWALAKATLAGAAAIAVAGDTVYVASSHSESTAATVTLTFAGTLGNPVRILSVDSGNPEPPTALLAGATIATTGASNITIAGFIYAYGLKLVAGDSTGQCQIALSNGSFHREVFEDCVFDQRSNNSNSMFRVTGSVTTNPSITVWKNCNFSCSQANARMEVVNGRFYWSGGQVLTPMTSLLHMHVGSWSNAEIENVDLSAMASTATLNPASGAGIVRFRNCKPPAGWTGVLVAGVKNVMWRAELSNTDTGDTNYLLWIEDTYGSIRQHSTLYLSGTSGIKHNGSPIPLSYKMTAETTASYPFGLVEGMWMAFVNESTASQTITLEIIHNEAAGLTDADIWLEVDYPATTGSTQYARVTDAKAGIFAAAVAQTASTAHWDDGLTERANSTAYAVGNLIKSYGSPGSAFICTVAGTSAASVPAGYTASLDGNAIADGTATFKGMKRQQLSVSVTAAEQGVLKARPVLGKAGAGVYVAAKLGLA
jgi:hypothetical protein